MDSSLDDPIPREPSTTQLAGLCKQQDEEERRRGNLSAGAKDFRLQRS